MGCAERPTVYRKRTHATTFGVRQNSSGRPPLPSPLLLRALVVMSVNPVTFVAPHLAWGEARGASARAPGASPANGAVTDEQRSPRPNGAQPSGRRFFAAQAALLAPYRFTGGICSSLAPCLDRKLL